MAALPHMSEKIILYIPLLDEGTPVIRPALGELITEDIYRVLEIENYNAEDEHWKFPPGKIVKCIRQMREGREILVAVEEYRMPRG